MRSGASPAGVLLVDKPAGITSTRALALAKRALGASKAGHTGTLDPFATGLLPLVFGEATKFSRFLIDSTKGYEATLRLGEETATGDTESEARIVTEKLPDAARIEEVLRGFLGEHRQTPPMHSAVHVDGRRLYEYAREGLEVKREAREIRVLSLGVRDYRGKDLALSVVCSKGTYVRVLAADIGRALGCGAYLRALRRTSVGRFQVDEAVALEALAAAGPERARQMLLPTESLVADLPRVRLASEVAIRFAQGQAVEAPYPEERAFVAVFMPDGGLLGVARAEDGRLAPQRLMAGATEMS